MLPIRTMFRAIRPNSGTNGTTKAIPEKGYGIFGQVNQSTSYAAIRDGTSNTIMTGELQAIFEISFCGRPSTRAAAPP